MSAPIGHNSNLAQGYLDKIEPLEMQIRDIKDDIKAFYDSAKEHGVKPKILRRLIKKRLMTDEKKKQAAEELQELNEMAHAVGMQGELPLG